MSFEILIVGGIGSALLLGLTFTIFALRRVVATNEVHIVQSRGATTSYGKGSGNGNTYYAWPSWLPLFGVTTTSLPMSVFDLDLLNYEAYDLDRLPFSVHVKAFFRVADSNVAAQRVSEFEELKNQLHGIMQGATRVVLAAHPLEEILSSRATLGAKFTHEVQEHLANWGVETVRNIELMDIRDTEHGSVIANIMAKKKSAIEMEARTEVAKNLRIAEIAEVEAGREVQMKRQAVAQEVGVRTIAAEREVALGEQEKAQAVHSAARWTKEKEMEVVQVELKRKAEIERDVQLVQAEQAKQTAILAAEAQLEAAKREAEGITLHGAANADAARAMQLAPVEAQIALAKEIGANAEYQNYLVTVRRIEAEQAIGVEQAKALEKADVKIIANTNDPATGAAGARGLFSASGGTGLGAMVEAFAQTEHGERIVSKLVGKSNGKHAE